LAREYASEYASLPMHPDEVHAIVQGEGVLEITERGVVSGGGDGRGNGGALV
jgi:hypothetical protein